MKFFRRRQDPRPQVVLTADLVQPDLSVPVEMSGTTTHGAAELARLYAAHDQSDGGLLELVGRLLPEPENPVDPHAVAVCVADARIGYLPGYVAKQVPRGRVLNCQVQLWGATTSKGIRVRGWVAASDGPVAWPHTASCPPAITVEERRNEEAAHRSRMVDQALAEGGERAEHFKNGMVGQIHFLETIEPIKQFKREGRLTEALALCYGAIEAAEKSREGAAPPPWYTEQAAIIHRKLGQRDAEVAVLQRWLDLCPPDRREGSRIKQRLDVLVGT